MTVRRELVMGRSVLHWARAFVMVAVPLVGCTDVSEFRTYRFIVTESLPDLTVRASEGVEICEADTDNCVTTGFGRADLDVPSNQEVTFTLEKEGFGPLLLAASEVARFSIAGNLEATMRNPERGPGVAPAA